MRRIERYIHELQAWPEFDWDRERLAQPLGSLRHSQGRLIGQMDAQEPAVRREAVLQTLTEEVVRSGAIDGEKLNAGDVQSSLARRLDIDIGRVPYLDRHVEGVVEMTLDATQRYDEPLTLARLQAWHALLFPAGRGSMRKVRAGNWPAESTGPMPPLSGAGGRERRQLEAPAASRLDREMKTFLDWFNGEGPAAEIDEVLKAGLAHLWFVTIHPFDEGNGRIARAIADFALARSEQGAQRFYSMSAQIHDERDAYHDLLERTQKGSLDVTPWMEWFVACLGRAIDGARTSISGVLQKSRFWQGIGDVRINERQRLLLNRLRDGVEETLTTSKWATVGTCSSDTALRDIADLVERGILVRSPAGGRSTSYALAKAR